MHEGFLMCSFEGRVLRLSLRAQFVASKFPRTFVEIEDVLGFHRHLQEGNIL
jgi:hypothetical protein